MENKHFFRVLPLAALALMMGACGNDEMENGMKDHVAGEFVPMTFTASMDTDADTRTSLVDGKAVHWNGGDNIVVIPSDLEEPVLDLAEYKFSSTLEVGQTAATTSFTGKAPEAETYIAFYPFERMLEYEGYAFESAGASFEIFALKHLGRYTPAFSLEYFKIISEEPAVNVARSCCAIINT